MQIVFNDEFDKLTPEMWNLMERAADIALRTEFAELENIDLENEPELGVTVVDDSEILELNREYREKDSVTDVLSFPQFEGHEELLEDLLDDEEPAEEEKTAEAYARDAVPVRSQRDAPVRVRSYG